MNNDHVNAQEPRQKLGEILLAGQKFSRIDLERALSAQQEMGGLLGRVLVRLGLVSESDVAQAVSQQLGVPLASAVLACAASSDACASSRCTCTKARPAAASSPLARATSRA